MILLRGDGEGTSFYLGDSMGWHTTGTCAFLVTVVSVWESIGVMGLCLSHNKVPVCPVLVDLNYFCPSEQQGGDNS